MQKKIALLRMLEVKGHPSSHMTHQLHPCKVKGAQLRHVHVHECLNQSLLLSAMAASQRLLLLLLTVGTLGLGSLSQDVILKPVKTGRRSVAIVLLPGPGVGPAQYQPLAAEVQTVSEFSVWVGIPKLPLDVVLLEDIGAGISRVLLGLQAEGMAPGTSLFLAAHSPLSAIPLQTYLLKNSTLAHSTNGQILLGSFLQRTFRGTPYAVKTLTIGGEVDGVCRVTRIMEEYYHRVQTASDNKAVSSFPVVVVRGMSHFQFASGDMPGAMKEKDFRPEISYDTAHSTVAAVVSSFMSVAMGNSSELATLTKVVMETGAFLKPLIEAYQLEGSYKLKPPCFENPPSPACQVGCPWTQGAMAMMAELTVGHVNDSDQIHPASEIFPKIHHPAISSNCSSPTPSCIVQVSSVSECVYHKDEADDGGVATSANEIRAKLKSRQSVMIAAGYGNVDFNKSDAGSRCKTINQQTYEWALNNSDPHTLSRFKEYGVAMVMGEDKGCLENGGLWIYLPMDYTTSTNSTGGEILVLQSIQLKTPVTYSIKLFAGMHYCKLLSPARAMEWVYVDGLRRYYTVG